MRFLSRCCVSGKKNAIIGISFPRYSMRTLKAMEFANDRNARVITITDSVHSPMNLYSSCNLLARSNMVSIVDSLAAPLSLINALVVALCLKRPDTVKESLESLEGAWNNYQVYVNDEINFIDEDTILTMPSIEGSRRKPDVSLTEKTERVEGNTELKLRPYPCPLRPLFSWLTAGLDFLLPAPAMQESLKGTLCSDKHAAVLRPQNTRP